MGSGALFPFLDEHLKMKRIKLPNGIKICVIGHLTIACVEFLFYLYDTYFISASLDVPWFRDPFKEIDLTPKETEGLADLKVLNPKRLAFKNKITFSACSCLFTMNIHCAQQKGVRNACLISNNLPFDYGLHLLAIIKTKKYQLSPRTQWYLPC